MNKEEKKKIEESVNEEVKEETVNEDADEQVKEENTENDSENKEETTDYSDALAESKEKYLRLAAEFDNYKKRTQREKWQIYVDAASDIIEAVLPFVDNMARATAVSAESEDAKNILEGIKLVERQFLETLKNIGVEEIKAVGEKFNPNFHNAVMHVDDETVDGEEIIVEEFEKGYMYKDKVIRHSTVKVAN